MKAASEARTSSLSAGNSSISSPFGAAFLTSFPRLGFYSFLSLPSLLRVGVIKGLVNEPSSKLSGGFPAYYESAFLKNDPMSPNFQSGEYS